MLRLGQRLSRSALPCRRGPFSCSLGALGKEMRQHPVAKRRWLNTGATAKKATLSGSIGKWMAANALGRGSGVGRAQVEHRLRVNVTSAADKLVTKARPTNPYAILIAVPVFILGVAFVGVDLITIATTAERKDLHEVLADDWRDEKVQETIYCFIEESVVPKLVTKVEAALVKGGKLPDPEEGEDGDATRASNRRAAQQYLQNEAKMNPLLSWKARRGVVAGPGPVIVPITLEHPLPVSVVFCKEVVNATAPIYVRVNGSNTKPLHITTHFVREEGYYRLDAVSVLDPESEQVSTCVYSHDSAKTIKTMPLKRSFAIAVGTDQLETPEVEVQREHDSYRPVEWWDCSFEKDRSAELQTQHGEAIRLVGSQIPKMASLSKLFGEDALTLQSHLPGLEYLARKARMNEILGGSLSEGDTLAKLEQEKCFRGMAEMYMAICKTSQEAFLRSNKVEPGFLECLAEGIRMFTSMLLVQEGMEHLENFHSFLRQTKDDGALLMYDLCKATLLISGHRYQEAVDLIEEAAEKIRVLVGEDSSEYANAMQMAAEAYFSMKDYPNALRCSEAGLAILGSPDNVDTDTAYLARICIISLSKLAPNEFQERLASNPIIASALDRDPASYGDILIRLCLAKIRLRKELPEVTSVAKPMSQEEFRFLLSVAKLALRNFQLAEGIRSRELAKSLAWERFDELCQPAVHELLMESKMLNRNGRPFALTEVRLNDEEDDVELAVVGLITLNDEVEVGMTVQVTVNDEEPFWVVVEEEHLRTGVHFNIPLSDISHPAHLLMEVGRSTSALESSIHAVAVPVPISFFTTQYGIDDLDKHFRCKALFESKLAALDHH